MARKRGEGEQGVDSAERRKRGEGGKGVAWGGGPADLYYIFHPGYIFYPASGPLT